MKTGDGTADVVIGGEQLEDGNAAAPADVVLVGDADGQDKLPKAATRNEDGTVSLKLRTPVTLTVKRDGKPVSEEQYPELTFHPMTGRDIAAMSATSDETRAAVMVGRSMRMNLAISNKLFDKMDARDARDAIRCAAFFLGAGE